MSSTRRTALHQLLSLSAGLFESCRVRQLSASASPFDVATPPKEITANIHGRKIRLKLAALKSQHDAALYCHLWILHLTYGLVIDQEFIADEDGMTLLFRTGADPEHQYKVTPLIRHLELTEDSQAGLALLTSCILAAVTRGDGFSDEPKSAFGEGRFRNWFAPPASANSKDDQISKLCRSILQRWNRQSSDQITDQQFRELAGSDTFEPTFRKERIQKVLEWLLQLRPTPKDTVSRFALHSFIDFVRWQISWMEHFAFLKCQGAETHVLGQLHVRDRSRWMALAIAYKCLLGSQPLPSVRIAVESDAMTPLAVILGGVHGSFLKFSVTAFGAENAHALATSPKQKSEDQVESLQDAFPQLSHLMDYPLYSIVASLGFTEVSKERAKFVKSTRCVVSGRIDELVTSKTTVFATTQETEQTEIYVSEPNWHWFRDWKVLKL